MSHRDTHSAIPQTLFDIAGIQARIHTLPGRPLFMLAADAAEVYQTKAFRVGEAVKRNPKRFPEDFAFYLTEAEAATLRLSQNAITSPGTRTDLLPLCFTHAGAYALSGVLTSDVAIEVGIAIYRAFAEIEARALADARFMLVKLRTEAMRGKSLRVQVIEGIRQGYSFEDLWQMGRASRPRLEQAIRECLALGLIDRLPTGMPMRQGDLFAEA
jgi:hypothetical protein